MRLALRQLEASKGLRLTDTALANVLKDPAQSSLMTNWFLLLQNQA